MNTPRTVSTEQGRRLNCPDLWSHFPDVEDVFPSTVQRGPSDGKDQYSPPRPANLSDLSGSEISPPSSSTEADPGHIFRLAQDLDQRPDQWRTGEEVPHVPWPDDWDKLPLPNEFFSALSELSGTEARAALLLVRLSFHYDPNADEWRTSPRYWTIGEIEHATPHGAGLCRQSLTDALRALSERGWAGVQEGGPEEPMRARCRLDAPKRGYTPVPRALLDTHPALPHSAVKLLLAIYRATWGWTRTEDGETLHRLYASLSASQLEKMAGLSAPTVREAAQILDDLDALNRGRPHRGAPWFYYPVFSFFAEHLPKNYTPTSREREYTNTPAGEENPQEDETAPRGPDVEHTEGEINPARLNGTQRHFQSLTASPFDLHRPTAFRLCRSRSPDVIEACLDAYEREAQDVENPGGWIRLAIEKLWYGPRTRERTPNRSRRAHSNTGNPIAQAFETMKEQNQGWEWGGDTSQNLSGEGEQQQTGPDVGLTHTEMCDAIDALHQPPGEWECIERPGEANLFVPDKTLARWAWHNRKSLKDDRAAQTAERIVEIRKDYEAAK